MAREITVAGAGIFGLACAWELTRAGAKVRVIERTKIGGGSSGGTVGALAPHVPENWNDKKQIQLDALIAAQAWWAEIARAGGVDPGYARTGRIQPIRAADRPRWQMRAQEAARRWGNARLWVTDNPDAALVPASPEGLWVMDTLTARVAPRRALAALSAALRAEGVDIIEGAEPDARMLGGDAVLWATGAAGLFVLSEDLGRPVGNGVKGQSALLDHAAPDAPQVFADALHIVPHGDGTVAIGSTSERDGRDVTTDDQLDTLIAKARAICPALAHANIIDRWAGIRPRAASRAPLLGAWPRRPGHFVANGGFKIGFAMALPVAQMMAELIMTGNDRIPDEMRLR